MLLIESKLGRLVSNADAIMTFSWICKLKEVLNSSSGIDVGDYTSASPCIILGRTAEHEMQCQELLS